MVVSHYHLGIHQDVAREDNSHDTGISQLNGAVVREEGGDKAEQDQGPQAHAQNTGPRRKVILGLAGEDGQADEDSSSQEDSLENNAGIVEGCDDGD